jgi:hypothetical protein
MFYEIIYLHILVHIYVSHVYESYSMLNNIFVQLGRISRSTARGYQLVIDFSKLDLIWLPFFNLEEVN